MSFVSPFSSRSLWATEWRRSTTDALCVELPSFPHTDSWREEIKCSDSSVGQILSNSRRSRESWQNKGTLPLPSLTHPATCITAVVSSVDFSITIDCHCRSEWIRRRRTTTMSRGHDETVTVGRSGMTHRGNRITTGSLGFLGRFVSRCDQRRYRERIRLLWQTQKCLVRTSPSLRSIYSHRWS